MVESDYDLPPVEEIAAEILKGIVKDHQIGVIRLQDYENFLSEINSDLDDPMDVDDGYFDFILLKRRAGYLTDAFTDISGLDVDVWARDRDRANRIMNEVTKRIVASEYNTYLGFLIDFATVLNGPEDDQAIITDERTVRKTFEFHIRVKWK